MTTQTDDPFAAAQVGGGNGGGTGTATVDPFSGAHDSADPFATSDDYRGGDFTPRPPIELLRGRLIVLFPREFEKEADDPFNPGKKRELYTADTYVLDGRKLVFPYKVKGDPEKGTQDTYETYDAGDITPETPFVMLSWWVAQGNLVGKLKRAHADGLPLLGVLDYIPQKAGRDKGVTAAQIRAEYDAWVARNKIGDAPKVAWALDVPTPERRKLAINWWAANKASIEPINRAGAPKSK